MKLGHSEIATTSRYYAKWTDTEHQQPPKLGPTEVYADFLAKLGKSHHSPTTDESSEVEEIENLAESQELVWRAGRDSRAALGCEGHATPDSQVRRRIPTRRRSMTYALATGM